MSQFTVILLVVIVCLISLFIWNGVNFVGLKKLSHQKDKELNDAKYWELKYKYEFLIAIVALITATAGFLGYNSLQSIEVAVKNDFNKKVDSVRTELQNTDSEINTKLSSAKDSVKYLNRLVKSSQLQLQINSSVLNNLRKKQDELKLTGFQSKKSLQDLSQQIDSINIKNKIKREFYLIPNREFTGKISVNNTTVRVKFADLKTISGDRLPVFKQIPIVLSTLSNTAEFKIYSIDKEGFEGTLLVYNVPNDDKMANTNYYISFIIYPTE